MKLYRTYDKVIIVALIIISFLFNNLSYSAKASNFQDSGDKVIYLTFDDGPIPGITEDILDILKEYNVKATFFVVGKEIKEREHILKRIHEEGHGIGLHTYSHKFSSIYKSQDEFIREMDETRALVEEVIGLDTGAIRFPGGSDLMLSQRLLNKLHERDYRVYDWNASLEDGVKGGASVKTLLENAKKIKGDKNRVFLLAHCNSNNRNTCKALPSIIEYYKEQGYIFSVIDENTEEYYFKIRKNNK
ncbi:MAG: polysaccharide deacetylase [Clostridiales bacterium]|uniref:polysaccharide deacetylase family protein n=1 Tax=Clostridium sp. N3C TaxID=1776758 RepID=UPI00092E15EA|nr:polysaccharide deacetylase family protein [Clostridium sp. N3C]NLZ48292.1 polysaccharide deacetylase [Clostridiales bacterium]SCN22950.1 putative polysaccharide deacetylase PdaA precursor [Clostridium sp. N3C]